MKSFLLEIVSPERLAYAEQVEHVSVPSVNGQLTILPHHTALFAALEEGEVIIRKDKENQFLAIGGGYVEVSKEKVMLLVSRAYHADELNEQAILKAKQQAEEAIKKGVGGEELHAAQSLLRSALVDLKVIRRRSRPVQ